MKINIILISITLSLVFPLWCATRESGPELDVVIQTRRLSNHSIERLEEKQQIAKSLHQFFVPFVETATNLMVLNNLCEAMNGGSGFTIKIWEDYLNAHKILTEEQMPLFQTIYGSVLRVLREETPSYFNPRNYFRSSGFLELLFGELGEKTFPSSYLKPLVFGEWRIYQQNGVPLFIQEFIQCLNGISQKMSSAISPTEKDCESWHSLPIEGLQSRKIGLDFTSFLENLDALRFQSVELGLKETTTLCADFRASLADFHQASIPLSLEIDRIIKDKKSPQKKPSPSQVSPHLLGWSVKGRKFADYVLLKEKGSNRFPLVLTLLGKTVVKDAGITPLFKISEEGSIICDKMRAEISNASVGIFLEHIWPTLHLFFTKGGLVPFTVYGAHRRSELQISFDGLEAQLKKLELTARTEKELLEKIHRTTLADLTRRSLLLEEDNKKLATASKSQQTTIKAYVAEQKTLKTQLEAAKTSKKDLETRLQEANKNLEETQTKLKDSRASAVAEDTVHRLEQEIITLRETHHQQTAAAQIQFEKDFAALRKDLETRLQEVIGQCKILQEQLDLLSPGLEAPPVSIKNGVSSKEAPAQIPPSPSPAAGNNSTPPSLKRSPSLSSSASHSSSRTVLNLHAPEFIPPARAPSYFSPPVSTMTTPDGATWILASNGPRWIPAPLPLYPYPYFA